MIPPKAGAERQTDEDADSAADVTVDRVLSRREVVAIIGGLSLAMFLAALNQTIVATALPTIGRDLACRCWLREFCIRARL